MSEAKHTKAPTQQKPVAHLPCCGYTDTSALQWNPYNGVAQCHNCGQVYTALPAHLIAAAPELLEALELILTADQRGFDLDYIKGCARAAIAKATNPQTGNQP